VILEVPVVRPETTPVEETTVATDKLLLLHVPPGVVLESDVVPPIHIDRPPVMVAGRSLIVTVVLVKQPAPVV
jgi:hypothetical protein